MIMQWFVLNTLTGQEQKVQKMLKAKASEGVVDLAPFVGETIVPTEKVISQRNGKKATVTRKLFPGYVFAELGLYRDARCKVLNKELWEYVNGLQGVIGFLGAERNHRGEMLRPPVPMTDDEIANIKATIGAAVDKPRPKVTFEPGELVKIVDGPFLSSVGVVQTVDPSHSRLTVSVTLFGGDTPVDLDYSQVERHVEEDKPKPAAPAPEPSAFDPLPTF